MELLLKERPDFLIGGAAGRWLKRKIEDTSVRWELLSSLKQAKKGMPRPDKSDLDAATKKYLKHITTKEDLVPKPELLLPWNVDHDAYARKGIETHLSQETIKEQIQRTVLEAMGVKPMSQDEFFKVFFPSTSANYIRSRKDAGALGEILEEILHHSSTLRSPGGPLAARETERDQKGRLIRPEEDERGDSYSDEFFKLHGIAEFLETGTSPQIEDLQQKFRFLLRECLRRAKEEAKAPLAEPVALAEALKVRMITKGPPYIMTILRNTWKVIHGRLQKQRTFRLIGEPLSAGLAARVLGKLRDADVLVSGDYAAATDNLASWASETVADTLAECLFLDKLDPLLPALLKTSLTGHLFETDEGIKRQTTGQLMGSITSFPVLCLINAAICRWALEIAHGSGGR